jgi:hypothetical protein
MSEFALDAVVPASMPVLSRGSHRNAERGACFMEYTALLAGEAHSDAPACVDEELAAVLRGANDKLSDADRPLLVPLLGRAIGLTVGPPPKGGGWRGPSSARRHRHEERVQYHRQALRLRRAVSRRFMAALDSVPSSATQIWSGCGEEVSWLFWDLMDEPTRVTTTQDYVRRMVARLHLLHDCYEQAMDEVGLLRPGSPGPVPTDGLSPLGSGGQAAG